MQQYCNVKLALCYQSAQSCLDPTLTFTTLVHGGVSVSNVAA